MAYATITDVSTRLGRTISESAEIAQVNAWIADVEALILHRIPDLAQQIVDGNVLASAVKTVVCQSVIRKIKNPDGKQNERIDDYSYGLSQDAARVDLFITDDEWSMITPRGTSGAAFSIRLGHL